MSKTTLHFEYYQLPPPKWPVLPPPRSSPLQPPPHPVTPPPLTTGYPHSLNPTPFPLHHHPTVIVIVIVSCGWLFLLAFMAGLLCFLKKRKKKRTHEEIDILHFDEHGKVKEEIVKGPHGTEAVEDDVHIDGEVIKKSSREKLGDSKDGVHKSVNDAGESCNNAAAAVVLPETGQQGSEQHEHHHHQPAEEGTTTN